MLHNISRAVTRVLTVRHQNTQGHKFKCQQVLIRDVTQPLDYVQINIQIDRQEQIFMSPAHLVMVGA